MPDVSDSRIVESSVAASAGVGCGETTTAMSTGARLQKMQTYLDFLMLDYAQATIGSSETGESWVRKKG